MTKLIKFLKPFTLLILLIIGLLFAQAMCELALPDYMSNIVNNGIQQGGIENAVPNVIRESEYEKVLLFIDSKDKDLINKNYTLIGKDYLLEDDYKDYLKEYPLIKTENLYILNTTDKDKIEELNIKIGKAILIVYQLENNDLSESGLTIPDGVDPFDLFKSLPAVQFNTIKNQISEKISVIPDSSIVQYATIYIKQEYKTIGMNTDNIQKHYVLSAGAKMLIIALLSMVASVTVGLITSRIAAGLGRNLRNNLFKKIENFSAAEFNKFGASSLITRTTNDIQQIQNLIGILIRIIFYAPIIGIGGFLKILNTDSSMSWIIGVAIAAIILIVIILFIYAIPKFKIVQKLIDKLNLVTRESLTGMLVIRAFNTEKTEEKKFKKVNEELTKTNLFINRILSAMFPIMMLIMNCVTILIVWIGSHQIDLGVIQVGDMMAFIQYSMQIIIAFLMITMVSIMFPRASVAASRIDEVLSVKPIINDPKNPKKFKKDLKGIIEFKEVGFKYSDAEDDVIKNISFKALPGQTTAFIGSTGSGKSTIINLIPRFYDPTAGEILIDGINIKDVTQHELRSNIGFVPQKGILFSGTIETNLKYGKEKANDEDMIEAVKTAQAYDFIKTKKEKLNTEIAQGGNNLSGGQKQRISIARALIKKSKIFIFDDTFSALDFKTDVNLRKALKNKIKDSTVLIVAQRISTIMNAEQIIVLENGEIVGIGKHNDLMKNCKVYQEIALSQLSKEELA